MLWRYSGVVEEIIHYPVILVSAMILEFGSKA